MSVSFDWPYIKINGGRWHSLLAPLWWFKRLPIWCPLVGHWWTNHGCPTCADFCARQCGTPVSNEDFAAFVIAAVRLAEWADRLTAAVDDLYIKNLHHEILIEEQWPLLDTANAVDEALEDFRATQKKQS